MEQTSNTGLIRLGCKSLTKRILDRLVAAAKAADKVEVDSGYEQHIPLGDREVVAVMTILGTRYLAFLIGAEVFLEDDGTEEDIHLYGFVDLVGPDCAEWGPISLAEIMGCNRPVMLTECEPGTLVKDKIPKRIYPHAF